MPELPEVETMRRTLAAKAEGRVLTAFEMHDDKLDSEPLKRAENTVLQRVEREGKCLVLRFETCAVRIHPRMTGRIVSVPPPRKHARFTMHFEGEVHIAFDDPRRLGTLTSAPRDVALREDNVFWPTQGHRHDLRGLREGAWLASRFNHIQKPLKVALLDGERIAGVGNIGASESCFYAGIAPSRTPESLDAKAWSALHGGLLTWVETTLAHEASKGELELLHAQGAVNPFAVYGREGEPCPRCSAPIQRALQQGRSTFFCESCQT